MPCCACGRARLPHLLFLVSAWLHAGWVSRALTFMASHFFLVRVWLRVDPVWDISVLVWWYKRFIVINFASGTKTRVKISRKRRRKNLNKINFENEKISNVEGIIESIVVACYVENASRNINGYASHLLHSTSIFASISPETERSNFSVNSCFPVFTVMLVSYAPSISLGIIKLYILFPNKMLIS